MTTKHSATEVSESLTGYDEIAITQNFGAIEALDGNMPARALAFVLFRRQGQKDADAKHTAMSVPAKTLAEMFEDDEVIPDDPVTESGKDSSPPESEPTS